MANLLLVLDPDAERRSAFCRRAASKIAPLPGLVQGSVSSGVVAALWAVGPRAPILAQSDADGADVLLGDALAEDGSRMTLPGLRRSWADGAMAPPLDGYHLAVAYGCRTGLRITTGLIGMMPVYWWANGDVVLAGSSPELFRVHPAFRPTLDAEGLAAILLTGYAVAGRTLERGVRRLAPGNVLWAEANTLPNERRQYSLPVSSLYHELPFSAQADCLHDAMVDAVRRHAPPNESCAQSLSGGRDSRHLAGLLHAQGTPVTAVTFGDPRDIEMRCAMGVARETARDHRALALEVDPTGAGIEMHARWTHCVQGFNAVHHWTTPARMSELPSHMVTGYAMDPIVAGTHMMWAFDKAQRRFGFDAFFARVNSYALSEGALGNLLAPIGGRDLVQAAKHTVRATYESYADLDSQRAWCFDIHHRQRLHVGSSPWQLSFGIWPVQPAVDRRVLEVAGGLSVASLAERRAQDAILVKRFPRLAQLPLDRNNYDMTPLAPRARHAVAEAVRQRAHRLGAAIGVRAKRAERRFYYRIYDVNGFGWRAARRLAEPHRETLEGVVDRAQLDACLPVPDHDIMVRNGIVDASGPKLLVGLLLWARDHLR